MKFGEDTVALATRATLRVGIELGDRERAATEKHFTPRLQKAFLTGKRLFGLEVPAAVAAYMWRTTVWLKDYMVAKSETSAITSYAHFACKGKPLLPARLRWIWPTFERPRLFVVHHWVPVQLATHAWKWLRGVSVGCTRLPIRWLSWHGPSPVGHPAWVEPSLALASTLSGFEWTAARNVVSMRAMRWPELDPEPAYSWSGYSCAS